MMTNADITTGQAIQEFYKKNNFGEEGGVNEKIVWIKFGFFSIPIPNVENRSKNVYLHDIGHLATGYDTSWKGESSLSAWEIGAGGWKNLYIPWLLTLWAMGLGALFYPKSVYKGFQKGLYMNNALTSGLSKEEIFSFTISELESRFTNKEKRKKNAFLWMGISLFVFLMPFITGIVIVWKIIF